MSPNDRPGHREPPAVRSDDNRPHRLPRDEHLFLIYFTWKDIRTDEAVYEQLRRFWTKIFAISFVVGTVTGIVLEFEFGTNFAAFATAAGELFGGPLAIEGMMAFMLEATFLGVFVFGRERVRDALYFVSSLAVGAALLLPLIASYFVVLYSAFSGPIDSTETY